MSKLDDVQYETYSGSRPQNEDGSYISITPKTREQIKAIFLDIIDEWDSDNIYGSDPEKLRDTVKAL